MLDPSLVLDHREHPVTNVTAQVGRDTLFSPKIERKVGNFDRKTAQNEVAVGNGLGAGSTLLMT
jgi:ABC-type Fe2+-enterobactin transport system substrate-binding protein